MITSAGDVLLEAIQHLDTIPGVARDTAEVIVAEIGIDTLAPRWRAARGQVWVTFPRAPIRPRRGCRPWQSRERGQTRLGQDAAGQQSVAHRTESRAHAAARTKNTYLAAQYQRLAARRGKKKAIMAVVHSILVIAYHLIQRREDYRELGGDYFEKRRPETTAKHLIKR